MASGLRMRMDDAHHGRALPKGVVSSIWSHRSSSTLNTMSQPPATYLAFSPAEPAPARKPTNLTLAVSLVLEARELGVNVSQAAEVGIAAAVAGRRQQRWLEENREALQSSNEFVEQHGLPLATYRNF